MGGSEKNVMIQRYNLKSIYWVDTDTETSRISKEFVNNDNGEWVKWEDAKAIIEENDQLRQRINQASESISNLADKIKGGQFHYGT